MNKELREIKERLQEMAKKEAIRLWRLARTAQKRGCSVDLIHEIREEADWLFHTATTYPDRRIYWKTEYELKYAFK